MEKIVKLALEVILVAAISAAAALIGPWALGIAIVVCALALLWLHGVLKWPPKRMPKAGTVPSYKNDSEALGNLLISFHRRGVTQILLQPPRDFIDAGEWRTREAQWQREVLGVMRAAECPLFDINDFEIIDTFPLQSRHSDPIIDSDLSMLSYRLANLKRIAEKYVNKPADHG